MIQEPLHWAAAVVAATIVGFSKSGIGGLGMLAVVIFAEILPARQATGVVLPLLIVGDLLALWHYHAHARWQHLLRLFPWAGGGVVLGYLALGRIDDTAARLLIGLVVLFMVGMHLVRRRDETENLPRKAHPLLAPITGVLSGFTTLVANAAGPLMTVYLLAMRLPKLEFVGTGAVFFFLINVFKVPFMVDLGLLTGESLRLNLVLTPAVAAGAWIGWRVLPRVRQRAFERLTLSLGAIAGINLIVTAVRSLL
jgi:uncharacterized membrane protein YfcA